MNVIMGSHCKGADKVGEALQQLVNGMNSVIPNGYIHIIVKGYKGEFVCHGRSDSNAPKAPGRKAQS